MTQEDTNIYDQCCVIIYVPVHDWNYDNTLIALNITTDVKV